MARWTGLEPATPGVTGRYSNQLSYHRAFSHLTTLGQVARWTGLEPATPGVTGRYSNQLSYHRQAARARPNVNAVLRKRRSAVKRQWQIFWSNARQSLSARPGGPKVSGHLERGLVGDDGLEPPTFSV